MVIDHPQMTGVEMNLQGMSGISTIENAGQDTNIPAVRDVINAVPCNYHCGVRLGQAKEKLFPKKERVKQA